MTLAQTQFDVAVVGAGIVGLSCALAAAQRGLRVVVIERDAQACGASVRNFGLVTITGQDPETVWPLARRSLRVWEDIAPKAGIPIVQRGLWIVARRSESVAVLEGFLRSEMSEGCRLLNPTEARRQCPQLQPAQRHAVRWSPHELRVESRTALPALSTWLEHECGVVFCWKTAAHTVSPPRLETSRGSVLAAAAVVCPGSDLVTLFPHQLAAAGVGRCSLQMLRLESPGFALPGTLMSDLSLLRYGGFANLPEAAALRHCVERDQPEYLQHGIHLIVAQASDGSLIVGDSHDYQSDGECFADERIDALLLEEFAAVTGRTAPPVRQRWTGSYAWSNRRTVLIDTPSPRTRLVLVTGGIGASTGFAVGENVIEELVGSGVH